MKDVLYVALFLLAIIVLPSALAAWLLTWPVWLLTLFAIGVVSLFIWLIIFCIGAALGDDN